MSTTQLAQTPAEAFESLPGYHKNDGDYSHGPGNRSYIGWAPGDDAMWTREDRKGRDSTILFDSWEEFKGGFGGLDDLNVVADFYFGLSHDSLKCPSCEGRGGSPEAIEFERTFYSHSCRPGEVAWNDRVTQEDVDALVEGHRLHELTHKFVSGEGWKPTGHHPTAEEVNASERGVPGKPSLGHDAINRWVMVKARCDRLGVPHTCAECEGHGSLRLSEDYLTLNLWMLHPRKGAARGIGIKRVPVEALDEVREWLSTSRKISNTWWAWVDGDKTPSTTPGVRDRDLMLSELRSDLDELGQRPSQHGAEYIRGIVDRAQKAIDALHTDVRGWETAEAS